jgi:hypothetical protein
MKTSTWVAGAAVMVALLQGCAVQKTMVATGGSRSDGTVKLAYEVAMLEKPQLDMQQGIATALEKCKVWGYTGAEPFGGQTKTCNSWGGGGCNGWLVTVEFQCTGTPPVAAK